MEHRNFFALLDTRKRRSKRRTDWYLDSFLIQVKSNVLNIHWFATGLIMNKEFSTAIYLHTYIIKGGKIWKGFIYFSTYPYYGRTFFLFRYFYPAQQQTTTIDRRLKLKKKITWKKGKTKRLLCVTLGGLEWRLSKMHLLQRT